MLVTYRSGFFLGSGEYEARETFKAAGFVFHPGLGKCLTPKTCAACKAGLGRTWWTKRTEAAVRLYAHADKDAKEVMSRHVSAVVGSRAMEADIEVPCPDGLRFYDYQLAGIKYLADRMKEQPGAMLADDLGVGKTIQILGLVNSDASIRQILVICPASLTNNWKREAQRWLVPGPGRRFEYLIKDEDGTLPSRANFVVMSYNRATILFRKCNTCQGEKKVNCGACGGSGNDTDPQYLCKQCAGRRSSVCTECEGRGRVVLANEELWRSVMSREWDLIVCDESHLLKNLDAGRTKCIIGNRMKDRPGFASKTKRIVFVSGTPLPNRPIEMWSVVSACAPKVFGHLEAYARRYCDAHKEFVGEGSKKTRWNFKGASNLEELQEKLRATCMIRRLKAEVLSELPPKTRQILSLTVSAEAAKLVDEELAFWREKYDDKLEVVQEEMHMAEEGKDETAFRGAVSKLEYIQNVAFVEMAHVRHLVAQAKLPLVIDHLENCLEGAGKIVVFAHHKDILLAIRDAFPTSNVLLYGETPTDERQGLVDKFQTDPTCRLFIGGILAASMGITLTASSHVVFAELSWVPWHITQAEDRTHRIGQKSNVLVQHLVWDGSLDARMAHMLIEKQEIAERALDKPTHVEKSLLGGVEVPVDPVPVFEKVLIRQALEVLAKDLAFSSFDHTIGQKLSTWRGAWSDRQAHLARKLVVRYRAQVPPGVLAELGIGEVVKPTRRQLYRGTNAVDALKETKS